MAPPMKGSGLTVYSMAMESLLSQMELLKKAYFKTTSMSMTLKTLAAKYMNL